MSLSIVKGFPDKLPDGLIFLPDSNAVRDAAQIAASDKGAILGPTTFTPYTFISEISRDLSLPPIVSKIEHVFLVKKLLLENAEFAGGARFIGFVNEIAYLVTSLRKACIFSGEDYLSKLDRPGNIQRAFAGFLDRYNKTLYTLDKTDETGRAFEVIKNLAKNGLEGRMRKFDRAWALWFEDIEIVQTRFFAALAKHIDVTFYLPAQANHPAGEKHILAANALEERLIKCARETGIEINFSFPPRISSESDTLIEAIAFRDGSIDAVLESRFDRWPRLAILCGRNYSEEAELVASAVKSLHLDNGIPLREIVVYAEGDSKMNIERALSAHGLPIEKEKEKPFADTYIAELLRRITSLVHSRFGRIELMDLLSHPLIAYENVPALDSVACGAGIIGGLPLETTWFSPLERTKTLEAEILTRILKKLHAIFDSVKGNRIVSGKTFADCINNFFSEFEIGRNLALLLGKGENSFTEMKNQAQAYTELQKLLDSFNAAPMESFTAHAELLLSFLESESPDSPGGEGVKVMGYSMIGRSDSTVAIVADVIQGKLPPQEQKFPFISRKDAESLRLILQGGAYRWNYRLLNLLDRTELTVLTRPLAEGDQPLPPAPLIVSFMRALGENREHYENRMKDLTESLLSRPFSLKRRQIRAGEILTETTEDANPYLAELADLCGLESAARALDVELAQRVGPPGVYDGVIGERFRPFLGEFDERISVSKICAFRTCPFAFLAERMLDIQVPPEPAEGVENTEAGTLLHSILERFWHNRIKKYIVEDNSLKSRLDALRKDFGYISSRVLVTPENLAEARQQMDEIIDSECERFEHNCLDAFAARAFRKTLEFSLMKYLQDIAESGETFIPVATEFFLNGKLCGVEVSAKADRIDVDSEGRLRVIDYKSGGSPSINEILGEDALQLPLYCYFLRDIGDIASGIYIEGFKKREPAVGGRFEREDCASGRKDKAVSEENWDKKLEKFGEIAERIIRNIQDGKFPPEPASGKCPNYCAYKDICKYDPSRTETSSNGEYDG